MKYFALKKRKKSFLSVKELGPWTKYALIPILVLDICVNPGKNKILDIGVQISQQ